jgi:hypothetical protein
MQERAMKASKGYVNGYKEENTYDKKWDGK